MSLYKSTNEMFNNSSLYHSDTYLGDDYTDGIKHYKYLYKEVRNGHNYYVYKDDEMKKARRAANKQFNKYGDVSYQDKDGNYVHKYKDGSTLTSYGRYNPKYKQSKKDAALEKNNKKAIRMKSNYNTQKIKDIPKRIHAKGIAAVSRMIMFFRGDYS